MSLKMPDHVGAYAQLLTAAEDLGRRLAEESRWSEIAALESIATQFSDGECGEVIDWEEADLALSSPIIIDRGERVRRRYRSSRKARNNVAASLDGLLLRLDKARSVVGEMDAHLPPAFRGDVEETLTGAWHEINRLRLRIGIDGRFGLQPVKDEVTSHTFSQGSYNTSNQALLWWAIYTPEYEGRLDDMLDLAKRWRISETWSTRKLAERIKRLRQALKHLQRTSSAEGPDGFPARPLEVPIHPRVGIVDEAPPKWAILMI
ncbi:MAG: hypothetical protein U0R19_37625 [Bryobacteraceae bacterium]